MASKVGVAGVAGRLVAAGMLALGIGAAVSAPQAVGQGTPPIPECAPGTPSIPAPMPVVTGDVASPHRVVAGRPFTIQYDEPGETIVDRTEIPPGTTVDFADVTGSFLSLTVPSSGPATFTALYYDIDAAPGSACVQRLAFTVQVEPGDLLRGLVGVANGPRAARTARFTRLPRRGLNATGSPVTGIQWACVATTASVPVVAELRTETRLTRRPSLRSPLTRLEIEDPCGAGLRTARGGAARLRFLGESDPSGGARILAVEHSRRAGARHWLRIRQGDRLLGELRYYVAFRPVSRRSQALWAIASEGTFERARCRPRGFDFRDPLRVKRFPIPSCPGRR